MNEELKKERPSKTKGKSVKKKIERKPAEKKKIVKRMAKPVEKKITIPPIKLFGKWDSDVEVLDSGLKNYINLKPRLFPRSAGIFRKRFHKSNMHIIERFALHLLIPGHIGKKHRLTSGKFAGNFVNVMKHIEKAFEIIEEKETKIDASGVKQPANPIEVFVRAFENAALQEEIISYQIGSIVARDAVITSPQRRVDKTLRIFAQGIYRKTFGKKKSLENAIADEILAAYRNSPESFAIKEKERIEREASGAR